MKKAMITIEVLVSMLILFLVIATSFENIKFFNIMSDKKISYEDEYMSVLSLKDKLSNTICKTSLKETGVFNTYDYSATCENIKELRTFKKAFELNDPSGNIGRYLMKLYKVNLDLTKGNFTKTFSYYVTVGQKLDFN